MLRQGDVRITNQKADMFSDPRFAQLGIKRARIDVAYDVLLDPSQTAQLDEWMSAAQAAGVQVLVTFDRSRRPGRRASARIPTAWSSSSTGCAPATRSSRSG